MGCICIHCRDANTQWYSLLWRHGHTQVMGCICIHCRVASNTCIIHDNIITIANLAAVHCD